jgi:hypothetical protein
MKNVSIIVAFALLLGATPALATSWEQTFAPERLSSYVSQDSSLVAVAAGQASRAQRRALKALIQGLRSSGRAKLVMDQKSVGRVSGLDDEDIVQRCAKLPVDSIAIMRLFPGGRGSAPTAVVTFYDPQGKVLRALSAQRGIELELSSDSASEATPEPAAETGMGVSAEAADAVADIAKVQSKSRKEAVERFERELIWFEDMVAVNEHGHAVNSWSNVYRGKYKEPLSSEEFYEAVGRPDLADEYRENAAARGALMLPSAVAGVAGLTALSFCWAPILMEDQIGEENVVPGIIGLAVGGGVVTAVGAVVGMIGGGMPLDPVTPAEARELADGHNKALASELGLVEE